MFGRLFNSITYIFVSMEVGDNDASGIYDC
jgi:hypothetical protein